MQTMWLLIANSSEATLYQADLNRLGGQLTSLQTFTHPESRKKGVELASDRPGHYQSKGTGHGSFNEAIDPKSYEAERFAKQLATELTTAHNDHRYQELILIAPPHFLGLLKHEFNSSIENVIKLTLEKDYTKTHTDKIITHVVQQLFPF